MKRPDQELTSILGIAEEAAATNKQALGRPTESDPLGWSMLALDNATELQGLIACVRFALDMSSPLADELLEKGAEKFLKDREDARTRQVRVFGLVQRGELGGQNG